MEMCWKIKGSSNKYTAQLMGMTREMKKYAFTYFKITTSKFHMDQLKNFGIPSFHNMPQMEWKGDQNSLQADKNVRDCYKMSFLSMSLEHETTSKLHLTLSFFVYCYPTKEIQ